MEGSAPRLRGAIGILYTVVTSLSARLAETQAPSERFSQQQIESFQSFAGRLQTWSDAFEYQPQNLDELLASKPSVQRSLVFYLANIGFTLRKLCWELVNTLNNKHFLRYSSDFFAAKKECSILFSLLDADYDSLAAGGTADQALQSLHVSVDALFDLLPVIEKEIDALYPDSGQLDVSGPSKGKRPAEDGHDSSPAPQSSPNKRQRQADSGIFISSTEHSQQTLSDSATPQVLDLVDDAAASVVVQAPLAESSTSAPHPSPAEVPKRRLESVPADQLGLLAVGAEPTICKLDIIAVHGLGAIPSLTWKAGGSPQSWLEDPKMLPAAIPFARILRFGYDSIWFGTEAVNNSITNIADTLREKIREKRRGCLDRPFILIGHCFGGLIIQQDSNLTKNCAGIIFLGTPHRGTKTFDSSGKLMAAILKAAADRTDSWRVEPSVLKDLEDTGSQLTSISDRFARFITIRNIPVTCFYEQKASDVSGIIQGQKSDIPKHFIVDEGSAKLDGHPSFGLPLNHFQLNKFNDPKDGNYRGLVDTMMKWYREKRSSLTTANKELLLANLVEVDGAAFDSAKFDHDHLCYEGTRVDILDEIMQWCRGSAKENIFWLRGMAGTGKSTIARTVATRLASEKLLGGSFFFSRGQGALSNAANLVSTLAAQLTRLSQDLADKISLTISRFPTIVGQSKSAQWERLIAEPLLDLDPEAIPHSRLVLVIDALDECEDSRDVQLLLQHFAETSVLSHIRLRVFLTSRPESAINVGFQNLPISSRLQFALHDVQPADVDHDIRTFFSVELERIRNEKRDLLADVWPSKDLVERLVQKAGGLFIVAATVTRFISDTNLHPDEYIELFLQSESNSTSTTKAIDSIYTFVLRNSLFRNCHGEERTRLLARFKSIVGLIAVAFDVLSLNSLATFLEIPITYVKSTLRPLLSVLRVPDDGPVRLLHSSFRDYILNEERSSAEFSAAATEMHANLSSGSQKLISALKRDIYGFQDDGVLKAEVDSALVREKIPAATQYASRYWLQHENRGASNFSDYGAVYYFFKDSFLQWVEAMGFLGLVPLCLVLLEDLCLLLKTNGSSEFFSLADDTRRFCLSNDWIIAKAPLQLYNSALLFSPSNSRTKVLYKKEEPSWMKLLPEPEKEWGAQLRTLEGHAKAVNGVAVSADGERFASASWDTTIRIWDAKGQELRELRGHDNSIWTVAFSPDGDLIASGSWDLSVRIWNSKNGELVHSILDAHSSSVLSVRFSPEGKTLVSSSQDGTIKLWDVATAQLKDKIDEQWYLPPFQRTEPNPRALNNSVYSVRFSPDGRKVAASSKDRAVRIWDIASRQVQRLRGHGDLVYGLAFSPDGEHVVSGSKDKTVRIWTLGDYPRSIELRGHLHSVYSVAYSPDGRWVASGSQDSTVRVWNADTGELRHTFQGHSGTVNSLAFTPDGETILSGSRDTTLRLWDTKTSAPNQSTLGHLDAAHTAIFSIVVSPDGKTIATGSKDRSVRTWDMETGLHKRIFSGHDFWVYSVDFSRDGKRLVSGSWDNCSRIFDVATSRQIHTFKRFHNPMTNHIYAVAFSPDGETVACGCSYHTVQLWNATNGRHKNKISWPAELSEDVVYAVAFSPDGQLLATGSGIYNSESGDNSVRIWYVRSGAQRNLLRGHAFVVRAVAFSRSGGQVVSGSSDNTIKIWDVTSGSLIRTFEGHYGSVSAIASSPTLSPPRLNVRDRWVTLDGKRVLLLPESRTVTAMAVYGNSIIIGSRSGQLTILRVKLDKAPTNVFRTA